MRIKLVLSRATLDLLWGLSDPALDWPPEAPVPGGEEVIVELDEGIVSQAIDLFDEPTLDEALRRLAHARLAG